MAQDRLILHAGPGGPIPHVDKQTEYIEAGAVTFGVEFRLLDDEISVANGRAPRDDKAEQRVADRGVSVHVFENTDGSLSERLRFDCFENDPHVHFINKAEGVNDLMGIDPVANGDPAAFAVDRIHTRLVDMLIAAGARDLAKRVDPASVDEVMPRLAEAVYRARFHTDVEAVRRNAVSI